MLTQVGIGIAIIICAFGICAIALAFVGTNWALTIAAALALILAGCWALVVSLLYSGESRPGFPSEEFSIIRPGPQAGKKRSTWSVLSGPIFSAFFTRRPSDRNWSGTVRLAHLRRPGDRD